VCLGKGAGADSKLQLANYLTRVKGGVQRDEGCGLRGSGGLEMWCVGM